MSVRRCSLLTLLLLVVASYAAAGQTVNALSGAINGVVKDGSGAMMPGVTVMIASPSQMGSRETVTTPDGQFRFSAVPPGEYTVTASLAGFSTTRFEGIRVAIGFTATVDVQMQPAGVEAEITVTGRAPVVDLAATTAGTTLDTATIANLPNSRDMQAMLTQIPSIALTNVDVGGSAMATFGAWSAHGTRNQSSLILEGIESYSNTQSGNGFFYNFGSFEEVQVNTAATGADMAMPGLQVRMISKSGSNQYHGSLFSSYENGNLQSHNIDAAQIAQGVTGGGGLAPEDTNRLSRFVDFDGSIGGFLQKDRLWWHSSGRAGQVATRVTNFPGQLLITNQRNIDFKATYAASPAHKFIAYYAGNREEQPARLTSFQLGSSAIYGSRADTGYYDFRAVVYKGEWNAVFSDRTLLEARVGNSVYTSPTYKQPGLPASPHYEDLTTRIVKGTSNDGYLDAWRPQTVVVLSTSAANHTFKVGGEFMRDGRESINRAGGYNDLSHMLQNGVPLEVYFIKNPVDNLTTQDAYTAYASDNWRLSPRVTANLGFRFDRYHGYQPEQSHATGRFTPVETVFPARDNYTWNLFAPRLGVAWAIDQSRRTVVKANFGQYWWNQGAFFSQTFNPNSNSWWERYAWVDSNNNLLWDEGEQRQLLGTSGGAGNGSLDPNFTNPNTLEGTLMVEREIGANVGVRAGIVWRGDRNASRTINANQPYAAFTLPVTIPDPGPDGITGNGDDGKAIQGFNIAPEYLGRPTANVVTNEPALKPSFWTWEGSATRRMHDHWSLMGSASFTRSTALSQPLANQIIPLFSPNQTINAGPNGEITFTSWTAKLNSTWEAPMGLLITPMLLHQSGTNWGRTVNARFNFGTTAILAEPISARRTSNITMVDVRVEKRVQLGGDSRFISGFVDVLNLTNTNPEQMVVSTSGVSFGRPTLILPPRLVRMGIRLGW